MNPNQNLIKLTFEDFLKAIIMLLVSAVTTLFAYYNSIVSQKDLEIKMLNEKHVEYVEQKEREVGDISEKVTDLKLQLNNKKSLQ